MYRRFEHPPPPSPATILPLQVPKQISNVAICRFTRQRPQVFKILRRQQAPEHIPDVLESKMVQEPIFIRFPHDNRMRREKGRVMRAYNVRSDERWVGKECVRTWRTRR